MRSQLKVENRQEGLLNVHRMLILILYRNLYTYVYTSNFVSGNFALKLHESVARSEEQEKIAFVFAKGVSYFIVFFSAKFAGISSFHNKRCRLKSDFCFEFQRAIK